MHLLGPGDNHIHCWWYTGSNLTRLFDASIMWVGLVCAHFVSAHFVNVHLKAWQLQCRIPQQEM